MISISAFGDSFYTPYEYDGMSTEDERIETSVSKTSGWCRLEVPQLGWLDAYDGGTDATAWIGSDECIDQDVTATWYISSTWTLDYRLACGTSMFNWYSKIELRVVYQIWSATGSLLQEREAWMDWIETRSGWTNYEATITRTIEKSFWIDLQEDYSYVFKVVLKVTLVDHGPDYQLTAHSNHNNPASLTVSVISYYLPWALSNNTRIQRRIDHAV